MKSESSGPSVRYAIWLAIVAALLRLGAAFVFFWAIAAFWVFAFAIYLPGLSVLILSALISLFVLVRRTLPLSLMPSVINIVTVSAFALAPWSNLSMRTDFTGKRPAMEPVAERYQVSEVKFQTRDSNYELANSGIGSVKLSTGERWLTVDGEVHVSETECGSFVFFPSYFGVPDGVGGYLFVPECAEALDFDGAMWGAIWLHHEHLTGNWHRLDGS
jgi:hypothetical protein